MGKKPKVIDPLAQVKAAPAKVTSLMLNPAASRNANKGIYEALPAFPTEIFACKNLVDLEIFRGIASGEIPDAIGTLTKLTSLSLGGLPTTELPASIGKLTNLQKLELAYMESLESLPASIDKLTKLVELSAPYAGLTSLPPLGALKKLAKLDFSNTQLTAIDPSLWDCKALTSLTFPESVTQLPPGISKLKKLNTLVCSVAALAGIANELPNTNLVVIRVVGKGTQLPDEIGRIETLLSLDATYLGLTSLPASLAGHEELLHVDVSGNQLATVIDLVAQLPKLRAFDYSGNPVAVAERREIDKLMKLSPSKRRAQLAKSAPKPTAKTVAKTKAAPKAKPPKKLAPIGQVASVNASLSLIIADAKVAAAWGGVGDGDDLDGSDWERARVALAKKDYAMVDVGDKSGVALSLGVGQGIANVFRVGDRIVVVEAIADNTEDELFLEYVASAPQKPKSVANLAIPSKKLVLVPTTEAGTSDESLSLDVPAKISITIEPETSGSWGSARRFFVTPA